MGRKKVVPLGRPPAIDEVWWGTRSHIQVEPHGCWTWTGTIFYGYGPYRRLYERYVQPLPKGHDLHHTCRNGGRGCVNPAHLEILTTSQHRSMHSREREKLTLSQASQIRAFLLRDDGTPHWKVAEQYGVCTSDIDKISWGEYFKELGGRLTYTRTCPHCHGPFVTQKRPKRFCSTECRIRSNDLRRLARKRAQNAARRIAA